MKNLKFWKLTLFAGAAGLLIFLVLSKTKIESPLIRIIEKPSQFLFSRISDISSFFIELSRVRRMTEENISLREYNISLLSRIASQLQVEEENKSLREILRLPTLANFKLIDAGTFNINFSPSGHRLLINKGLKDGIQKDSSVISSSHVLIGRVIEVFDYYSVVGSITDPDFKATIRMLETNVSGIARGSLHDGVFIDFISQDEDIKEGDTVVTDGNDLSPPGMIIGKVSHINVEDGNLFKKIQAKPMIYDINISRVIVLIK